MSFVKSFKREMGRNTGKWASNKVFGNTGWATPRRHIIEVEERKKLRSEARHYRETQIACERQRRQREREVRNLEKEQAQKEKDEAIRANQEEVREYNSYICALQSIHKTYSERINWQDVLNTEPPEYIETPEEIKDEIEEYTRNEINEKISEVIKLNADELVIMPKQLVPRMQVFMLFVVTLGIAYFKRRYDVNRRCDIIEDEIGQIKSSFNELLEENIKLQQDERDIYNKNLKEYESLISIGNGVVSGDMQSFIYALNYFKPLDDLKEYGSDITFRVKDDVILVDFFVHNNDVIPKTVKSLLRNGASVKETEMPASRFNGIYQDYVCSCVLKIAKEVFQVIHTLNRVVINVRGSILNTGTGNFEEHTILSVIVDQQTLNTLNFQLLNPSDSLVNFDHRMNFNRRSGFEPVSEN